MRTGFRHCQGDIVVFLPSDLESDPEEDIPKLVAKINEGYDVVSGWRQGRRDGKIVASTRRRKDMIEFELSDSGQGIPPEDLPRIFDRFFRSEASRAAGEGGFGLGLAICKSIVDSMGGIIDVSSVIGKGTTFVVKIPRGRV